MYNTTPIAEFIGELLKDCRLAVMATEGNGQPHASLIAVTPFRGFREMIFATYRNTLKFENLSLNGRVAVLIQDVRKDSPGRNTISVLTAYGHAAEIGTPELEEAVNVHRERHPDLAALLQSPDFAIFRVKVERYQIVRGIDDVVWLNVEDAKD